MPHSRARYADPLLKRILSHSPIAGIIGQRQTGKTTLAERASAEYETLDLKQTLERAANDPQAFLHKRKHPLTIDECQLLPELFPALKEQVRRSSRRGQFILTGSVRFTSRKAIRESLTGRIVNQELLPLSLAENHSEDLPGFLPHLLRSDVIPEFASPPPAWLDKYGKRFFEFLETGGLPGICFYREPHVRASRFETQLETLLERDIRLVLNTEIPFRRLRALLAELAAQQGKAINLTHLGRVMGVTAPSARRVLRALEAMFLIRTISSEKQAHPVLFLEDQGMASYLASERLSQESDLVRGVFACVLPQFLYRPETAPVFYQYRTRGGATVDIAVKTNQGRLGVIPVVADGPTTSSVASAKSYVSDSPKSKVIIAHTGTQIRRVSDCILALPFQMLLSDQWR